MSTRSGTRKRSTVSIIDEDDLNEEISTPRRSKRNISKTETENNKYVNSNNTNANNKSKKKMNTKENANHNTETPIRRYSYVDERRGPLSRMGSLNPIMLSSEISSEFDFYLECCNAFGTIPDPGASIAFAYEAVEHLVVSKDFKLKDLLPLCAVLIENTNIKYLDLSNRQLGCTGAHMLKRVFERNCSLVYLDLSYNTMKSQGCSAISDALKFRNIALETLNLAGNEMNPKAARLLAEGLRINKSLRELDLSYNYISLDGVSTILDACKSQLQRGFELKNNSNFVMQEIGNSITNGFGLILGFVGQSYLLEKARNGTHPPIYYWSCLVYSIFLIMFYFIATLNYALARLPSVSRIFNILDYSAVSLAIAATYTPFCLVSLGHTWVGIASCVFVWILAVFGVCLSITSVHLYRTRLNFAIIFGWCTILATIKWMLEAVPLNGMLLLFVGGVLHTFCAVGSMMDMRIFRYHSHRQVIVLLASVLHYFAIYFYCQPFKEGEMLPIFKNIKGIDEVEKTLLESIHL